MKGENHPNYGKKRDKSIGVKISKALTGKKNPLLSEQKRGEKNNWWKGGTTIKGGRAMILDRDNPMSWNNGYVYRSRKVMSDIIGRPLNPEEVVHHKDGDITNDSPDNLELFENTGEHTKFHMKEGF
jgi:hypothetical protein